MTNTTHLHECPRDEPGYLGSLAAGALLAVDAAAQIEAARAAFFAPQEGAAQATLEAQPVPQRTFTLLSAADILAMQRVQWRVKGAVPAAGIAAIFGQPGSAKTFIALDMAFAVAGGADWFDMRTAPCPVIYINLESCGGLKKRLLAWQLDRKRPVPDDVRFVVEPFHILEDVDMLARDIPTGAVVFLDTLNAAAPGLDENSSRDMGLILEAAKKLQRLTGGLVVLVHHCGKDGSKGLRGHSSLLAALDCAVEVGRNGDARHWRIAKAKEAEDGKRRGFRLKAVGIGCDEGGEPETSCVVEPDDTVQGEEKPLTPALAYCLESLERALAANAKESVHLEEWRPHFYEQHTGDTDGAKRAAFNRDKNKLVHLGRITVKNNNYALSVPAYSTGQERTGVRSPESQTAYRTVHPSLEGVRSTQGDRYAYE